MSCSIYKNEQQSKIYFVSQFLVQVKNMLDLALNNCILELCTECEEIAFTNTVCLKLTKYNYFYIFLKEYSFNLFFYWKITNWNVKAWIVLRHWSWFYWHSQSLKSICLIDKLNQIKLVVHMIFNKSWSSLIYFFFNHVLV